MANLIWTSSWPLYRLPVTKTLQKKEDEICHKIYIVWRTSILGPEFTFNNPILLYSPSTLRFGHSKFTIEKIRANSSLSKKAQKKSRLTPVKYNPLYKKHY